MLKIKFVLKMIVNQPQAKPTILLKNYFIINIQLVETE